MARRPFGAQWSHWHFDNLIQIQIKLQAKYSLLRFIWNAFTHYVDRVVGALLCWTKYRKWTFFFLTGQLWYQGPLKGTGLFWGPGKWPFIGQLSAPWRFRHFFGNVMTRSALLVLWEGNPPVNSPPDRTIKSHFMLSLLLAWTNCWANSRVGRKFRCHDAYGTSHLCKWAAQIKEISTLLCYDMCHSFIIGSWS